MKRLFVFTIILFAIAGVTFWQMGKDFAQLSQKPSAIEAADVAVAQFLPQATAGNMDAQFALGQAYETGQGALKNAQEAYFWYKKSADKGHPKSRYQLGMMYADGKSAVRQDFFLAAKWFRVAATFNHHAPSQFRLGELYFNGRGVEHDYGKAIELYTKAARQGHAGAQYLLGAMYQEGWGVAKDFVKAYVWLKQAVPNRAQAMAIHKKYDPVLKFEILKEKMNKFQLSEAEKRFQAIKTRR